MHDLTSRAFATDRWRDTDNATPLVYSGCHFVDLLRWFAGEEIVEVFAAANHRTFDDYPESDLNVVTMRFASGVIAKVVVAFGEPGPQDHTVRVAGSDASVRGNLLYTARRRAGRRAPPPDDFSAAAARRPRKGRRPEPLASAADESAALSCSRG